MTTACRNHGCHRHTSETSKREKKEAGTYAHFERKFQAKKTVEIKQASK